jgi:uncharacterized protein (DUF1684 family)
VDGQGENVAWQVADWRRQVASLYAAVRAAAKPRAGWALWRDGRDRLFRDHPASPLTPANREGFRGLASYGYDPALRFEVATTPADGSETIAIDLGNDGTLTLRPLARTLGLADALGGELTVYWIAAYGGGLFLPFGDATNGRDTYGGGRYLLDSIKGADLGRAGGRLILDFNFAYYPSCAHSPAWTCPLPMPENRLPALVEGGERD